MDKVGILLLMQAQVGKELQVERFLKGTELLAEEELGRSAYYVFRLDHTRFGIFVTAKDENDRDEQRRGRLGSALLASAKALFDPIPIGENVEILVTKAPIAPWRRPPRREHASSHKPPGLSGEQMEGLARSLMRGV
jgi:hypothetical protein